MNFSIWSESTVKRRRRSERRKKADAHARMSAAATRRLRDPRTGTWCRVLDQPIRRVRNAKTGRFYNPANPPVDLVLSGALPMPKHPSVELRAVLEERERQRAAVAEVVARYLVRPLHRRSANVTDVQLVQFETDARRILDALAARMIGVDAEHPADINETLKFARRAARLHESMSRLSGHVRTLRPAVTTSPVLRELDEQQYAMLRDWLASDDGLTPFQTLKFVKLLIRLRHRLGVG